MFLSERAIVHFYHGYEDECYGEGKGGFPKARYRFILLKKQPNNTEGYLWGSSFRCASVQRQEL